LPPGWRHSAPKRQTFLKRSLFRCPSDGFVGVE
jgi:hypothetical protein